MILAGSEASGLAPRRLVPSPELIRGRAVLAQHVRVLQRSWFRRRALGHRGDANSFGCLALECMDAKYVENLRKQRAAIHPLTTQS